MGDLGTKNALIVPGAHGNARAGTKTASNVSNTGIMGTKCALFVPKIRKNRVLGTKSHFVVPIAHQAGTF